MEQNGFPLTEAKGSTSRRCWETRLELSTLLWASFLSTSVELSVTHRQEYGMVQGEENDFAPVKMQQSKVSWEIEKVFRGS